MKRGDYDYHHASSNTQFIIMILVILACVGGLALGLMFIAGLLT